MYQIVPELRVLRGFPPYAINVYLLGDVLRPLGTHPSGSEMPHRERVDVTSAAGHGSTFAVCLPVAGRPVDAPPTGFPYQFAEQRSRGRNRGY